MYSWNWRWEIHALVNAICEDLRKTLIFWFHDICYVYDHDVNSFQGRIMSLSVLDNDDKDVKSEKEEWMDQNTAKVIVYLYIVYY